MNKKKIKSIGIIAILIICTISYFSFAYRESSINKGFPIPAGAHVTNFDSVNKFEEYDWTHASIENGLPC